MRVSKALAEKVEQVEYTTDLLLSSTVDWQTIKQYLVSKTSNIKLTDKQLEKLERYQFIYNQLVSGQYTDSEVISMVCKTYKIEAPSVAWEDMNATRELFNTIININKHFEIKIQLEINRRMMSKAELNHDIKGFSMLEKNRVNLIAQLPDPVEEANPFEGHTFEPVFDPSLIGAEDVDMDALVKEINSKHKKKIKTELFTDIEHEEIPETDPL